MSIIPKQYSPYIASGRIKREKFQDTVDEFFDDFDSHVYIRGQAGVGKTYTITKAADDRDVKMLSIDGDITKWAFTKKLAVACYTAGWPGANQNPAAWLANPDRPRIYIFFDDCGTVLNDDMVTVLKIALEDASSDKLAYGSSLGSQVKLASELEQQAIAHFTCDADSNFEIPFYNQVRFVFTMNRKLSDRLDVEKAIKTNKSDKTIARLENRYAFLSRVNYIDLLLSKDEYWGWLADLLLNENAIPEASVEDCEEMLMFCYPNWDKLTDISMRTIINKLWKYKKKAKINPDYDYLSRWYTILSK